MQIAAAVALYPCPLLRRRAIAAALLLLVGDPDPLFTRLDPNPISSDNGLPLFFILRRNPDEGRRYGSLIASSDERRSDLLPLVGDLAH